MIIKKPKITITLKNVQKVIMIITTKKDIRRRRKEERGSPFWLGLAFPSLGVLLSWSMVDPPFLALGVGPSSFGEWVGPSFLLHF